MNFNNLTTTEESILNSINDALILDQLQDDNSDYSKSCQGIEIAFEILGITSEPNH